MGMISTGSCGRPFNFFYCLLSNEFRFGDRAVSAVGVSGTIQAYLCIIYDVTYAMVMLYAYLFF